jgi:hypothetical protein
LPARHASPLGQSVRLQHSVLWQAPLQHRWPLWHSESAKQARQLLPLHTCPARQSLVEQQSPLMQPPPQHLPGPPSAAAHCASLAQERQL